MNSNPPSNAGKGAAEAVALLGKESGSRQRGAGSGEGAAFKAAFDEARGGARTEPSHMPQRRLDITDQDAVGPARAQTASAEPQHVAILDKPALTDRDIASAGPRVGSRNVPAEPLSPGTHEPDAAPRHDEAPVLKTEDGAEPARGADADTDRMAPELPRQEGRRPDLQISSPQQTADRDVVPVVLAHTPPREPARPGPGSDRSEQARDTANLRHAEMRNTADGTPKPQQLEDNGQTSGRQQDDALSQGGARRALDLFGFARSADDTVRGAGPALAPPVESAAQISLSGATVTVVEAKQFPGLSASQSSAAAVVSAVTGDASWSTMLRGAESISAQSLDQVQNTVNTLKIRLNPAELGNVDATLKLSGGQLVMALKVETIEAYRHLSDSQNVIVKALKNQGYTVEHITVQQPVPERGLVQQSVSAVQGGSQAAGDGSAQTGQHNSPHAGTGDSQGRRERDGQNNDHNGSNDQPAAVGTPDLPDAVYL